MPAGPLVFVKLLPQVRLPQYKTELSVACDIYMPELTVLEPSQQVSARTGLICVPPRGYHAAIYLRSSTGLNYPGLTLVNAVGLIDGDYVGPEDELRLLLHNSSNNKYVIPAQSRLVQLKLEQLIQPTIIEEIKKDELQFRQNRGGFGSTGQ